MVANPWFAPAVVIALTVHSVAAVFVALKLVFVAGELNKTIKGHSRLLSMIPCLKPRACAELQEEEQ